MIVISFIISIKLETNLLRKLIFPKKDLTSFLDLRIEKAWIASILLGSILNPSADTMCPSYFPSFMENNDFLGFKERPNFLHFKKTLFKCSQCSAS
jgi:hypothetical protein